MRPRVVHPPLFLVLVGVLSCRERERPAPDSAADTTRISAVSDRAADWPTVLGPLLIVPADNERTGVVLIPAAPNAGLIAAAPLTLLSPSGDSMRVRASLVVSDTQVCGEAPTVQIRGGDSTAWTVGMLARPAVTLPMDSIEALPPADSAGLAAELARLASSLPPAKDSRFTGLPFVVLSARRFQIPDGQVVVAHLVRRLPQEATPLQEHILVVADRPTSAGAYALRHHERSQGTEETADHYEILSAARKDETTYLLISREQEAQTVYELLERGATGAWRLRWDRMLAC